MAVESRLHGWILSAISPVIINTHAFFMYVLYMHFLCTLLIDVFCTYFETCFTIDTGEVYLHYIAITIRMFVCMYV